MSEYHFDPDTYEAMIAEEVPWYSGLQEEVAAAADRRSVQRILDLGTGTGATASRLLGIHPHARLVGVDESAEMLAATRRVRKRCGGCTRHIGGLFCELADQNQDG